MVGLALARVREKWPRPKLQDLFYRKRMERKLELRLAPSTAQTEVAVVRLIGDSFTD
jgi:hypothetical protein